LKITALAVLAVAGALLVALPASAATPTFKGTVGPGFTITMASKPKKAGKIKLVVADKSSIHNFHLTGPGVNVKTSVSAIGSKTFTVTLKKGTYKFVCDPHSSSMKGSFTVK
jgi:plastocyanin